jgi:hypothetical protein
MSDRSSKQMNPHEKWLRNLATELQSATPPSTSCTVNTVLQAANEIGALQQYHDWASPQVIMHGRDTLEIERLTKIANSAVAGRHAFRQMHIRSRYALTRAVEWAGPMAEAPADSRPAWFDIALEALSGVTPDETSGVNPLNKRVHVACKDNVSSWEYPHMVICFNSIADLNAAALYLSSSPLEPTRKRLRDSDAAFNLGVLPTEQPEKATSKVVPSVCGKPMPDGKGAGQCINVPGHEGECDDMPF